MDHAGAIPAEAAKPAEAPPATAAGGPSPPKRPRRPAKPSVPRGLLIVGAFLALGAPLVYGIQFAIGILSVPWYVPIAGSVGALILFVGALRQRRGLVRVALVVVAVALAGVEWLYLMELSVLPAYTGPVATGKAFPEFYALRPDGTQFTRGNLRSELGTVMVFFRGRWCPYCMKELEALNARWQDFEARKLQVVAVSIEAPDQTKLTQQDFPHLIVLSDQGHKMAEAVGVLRKQSGFDFADTAMPTTFIIDGNCKVLWLFRPSHVVTRPSPDFIFGIYDELSPKVW